MECELSIFEPAVYPRYRSPYIEEMEEVEEDMPALDETVNALKAKAEELKNQAV